MEQVVKINPLHIKGRILTFSIKNSSRLKKENKLIKNTKRINYSKFVNNMEN